MIQTFHMDRCHRGPFPEYSRVSCRSIQRKVKDFFSFFTCSMSGLRQRIFIRNVPEGPHAEEGIRRELQRRGINDSDVIAIYSEYHPCRTTSHNCELLIETHYDEA